MINVIWLILVTVHAKSFLLFIPLHIASNVMIGRDQATLCQLLHNCAMISRTMFCIPLRIAIEITDDNGMCTKLFKIDRLVYVVFLNVWLTCPNAQNIQYIAYSNGPEMPQTVARPVVHNMIQPISNENSKSFGFIFTIPYTICVKISKTFFVLLGILTLLYHIHIRIKFLNRTEFLTKLTAAIPTYDTHYFFSAFSHWVIRSSDTP